MRPVWDLSERETKMWETLITAFTLVKQRECSVQLLSFSSTHVLFLRGLHLKCHFILNCIIWRKWSHAGTSLGFPCSWVLLLCN